MSLDIEREDIALRLVEERGRLGYSQADFAHQIGISKEALRLNELGKTGISTEVLGKAAVLGVDVQYIITGIRSNNVKDIDRLITTKRDEANQAKEPKPAQNTVKGDSNNIIFGDGGTITSVVTPKYVTETKVLYEPTETHISQEMAARLKELVNQIVAKESILKKKPKSYAAVYSTLNKHCGVTKFLLIAKDDYKKAETYLLRWLRMLDSTKSAPKKLGVEWRKAQYKRIKAMEREAGIEAWVDDYLQKNFAVGSITELSSDQLEKAYHAVYNKRNRELKKQQS